MPAKSTRTLPQPDDLGWSLGILLRHWQHRVEETIGDLPHGPRGYQILSAVVHDEPPTQVALAAHLGIDRTVITYLIDSLVEAGMVERVQDPADRRARRIVATAAGLATLHRLQQQVTRAENEILGGLTDAERTSLRGVLRRTAVTIHTSHPGTDPCEAVASVLSGDTPPEKPARAGR